MQVKLLEYLHYWFVTLNQVNCMDKHTCSAIHSCDQQYIHKTRQKSKFSEILSKHILWRILVSLGNLYTVNVVRFNKRFPDLILLFPVLEKSL